MKLHLPICLFRAIISLMMCAAFQGHAEYTIVAPDIPDSYSAVSVAKGTDVSYYLPPANSLEKRNKVWCLTDDIVFEKYSTPLLPEVEDDESLSWIFTSAEGYALKSITIKDCSTRLMYVSDDGWLDVNRKLTLQALADLRFENNFYNAQDKSAYGGVIGCGDDGLVTLSHNRSIVLANNSLQSENGSRGGGVAAQIMRLEHNEEISSFSNNASGKYVYGGALWAEGKLLMNDNGDITFEQNEVFGAGDERGRGSALGGAISITSDDYASSISGNGILTFKYNKAYGCGDWDGVAGGAISCAGSLVMEDNKALLVEGNAALGQGPSVNPFIGGGWGGGISALSLTICNTPEVSFISNRAEGIIQAYGGALSCDDLSFENCNKIDFESNKVIAGDMGGTGGAIRVSSYDGVTSFIDCNRIKFTNNTIQSCDEGNGGAISANQVLIQGADSISFVGNGINGLAHGQLYGGAISASKLIKVIDNDEVLFEGNFAKSTLSSVNGGALSGNKVQVSGNRKVSFKNNIGESSAGYEVHGGAICAYNGKDVSIELYDNQTLEFIENSTSLDEPAPNSEASGGALSGTIRIHHNGTVEFRGNSAILRGSDAGRGAEGGAITQSVAGAEPSIYSNERVLFIDNVTQTVNNDAIAGAICGKCCLLNNGVLRFENNKVCISGTDLYVDYAEGGALNAAYLSSIGPAESHTIEGNESVVFSGNGATVESSKDVARGGAIFNEASDVFLSNNKSVLFEKNYESVAGVYRLRSLYADESDRSVVMSAPEGGILEFRDSIFIDEKRTVSLNRDYSDSEGNIYKQTGDILLTGAYAENHLRELKGAVAVTNEEVLNSQTSQVKSMTYLYGGRLRVEDGAIFKSHGLTLAEDSAATLKVKDATVDGQGYELTFHSGSSLELDGANKLTGHVILKDGSSLVLGDTSSTIRGDLQLEGTVSLQLKRDDALETNHVLLALVGELVGWNNENITFIGANGSISDVKWVNNMLVYHVDEDSFNPYPNGSLICTESQTDAQERYFYQSVTYENITDCAANADRNTCSVWNNNGVVMFRGNAATASGGAIYGDYNSSIILRDNGSVSFVNNSADKEDGGAIYGDKETSITLSNNSDVLFSGNHAIYGGAIYSSSGSSISLSDNGCVTFSGNKVESYYSSDSASGGAIRNAGNLYIRNNEKVVFEKNLQKRRNDCRLCSINTYGSAGTVISLSAPEGGSIEIRDSLYINPDMVVEFNADYEKIKQTGDIIFTGATTEDDLQAIKGSAGTSDEITNSRTSLIETMTNLYGGRLRVEDGAIYEGHGITAHADTGSTVWLRNAHLKHAGYDISLSKGTGMGLRGCNTSSANLVLADESNLSFEIDAKNMTRASLSHTGSLTLGSSITLNIGSSETELAHGSYLLLSVADKAAVGGWTGDNFVINSGDFSGSDLSWVENTLCFNYTGQTLSQLPELAEITITPDEPVIPDEPVTPDEPEIPDEPVTPDEPVIPDEPVTPDEPEIPDEPVTPDEPVIPDEPVTPDEPVIPDEPVTPDEPVIPDEPVTPDEPEIPDTPVTPDEPEKSEPLNPLRPGAKPVLVGGDIDKNTEVILTEKGNVTLEGKVNAGAITVNSDKNITFKSNKKKPGSLTGDGDLTKKGKGTLTLNDGNSSWTGDTYLQAGTIKVKGISSLGKGDVYVQGGVLNLGSKAIANDIVQEKSAAIKSGKKFTGTYTLENGELQKGSTLNIAKTATLAGGTVNGALSGTGKTEVTGNVKLGDKGKITTNALSVTDGGNLTTSSKGLSMNSKASVVSVEEDASLNLGGKLSAKSLTVNDGTFKTSASKPAAVSLKGDMTLKGESTVQLNGKLSAVNLNVTDSSLVLKNAKPQSVSLKGNATLNNATATINGKFSSVNMTLNNNSSLTLTAAKPQNLTVKQNLTIGSGSALTLNGKLSAGSLTIKKDGMLTMSGSKPVTLKVKGALTLNEGSSIILNYSFVQGKTYKVLTFSSYSGSKDYYSIFGVDADDCSITNTGKALTLTVNTKWKPQTQQKAVAAETPVVAAAKNNPVADALVQSNWGQLEASRAFVYAMANRSMAVQLGNGERAVWASAIGSSSRHDTASGHNGADTNVSGGAFGLETQVGRASLFGLALGNSWTRVSAHGFGTIEQDTTHLGLYGQTNWRSGVTADWSAAYGRSESESMGCEWNQKQLQLDGRVSYNHELNANTVLSPFAGVQYYASDSAAIGTTDTGSLQNLRAEIGVGASHRTGKLGVYGEIALHQDIARNNPSVSMEGVRYTGMNPGRTGLNFTVGTSYELNDKWSVNASYTGEFVENANAHSANVGASYKF